MALDASPNCRRPARGSPVLPLLPGFPLAAETTTPHTLPAGSMRKVHTHQSAEQVVTGVHVQMHTCVSSFSDAKVHTSHSSPPSPRRGAPRPRGRVPLAQACVNTVCLIFFTVDFPGCRTTLGTVSHQTRPL